MIWQQRAQHKNMVWNIMFPYFLIIGRRSFTSEWCEFLDIVPYCVARGGFWSCGCCESCWSKWCYWWRGLNTDRGILVTSYRTWTVVSHNIYAMTQQNSLADWACLSQEVTILAIILHPTHNICILSLKAGYETNAAGLQTSVGNDETLRWSIECYE